MRKQLPNFLGTMLGMAMLLSGFSLMAQQREGLDIAPQVNPSAERAPGFFNPGPAVLGTAALWDIEFAYNATDSTFGDAGMAAANFINNEFWVSRWQSDTLYRFDINGSLISEFTIAGLTGTRSLTSDGTYLYAGTATNTIYRIDPTTQMLAPPHITISAPVTARHCTYDSTLNGNAGGFWIGNFNTDIVAVSMTGAQLSVIPAATHGLGGMYGSAFDNVSAGGPYLWIFHQGGAAQSQIERLQLPSGTPTLVTHDVMSDVGANLNLASGLAGGLFISNELVPGEWTIGGLVQGSPSNVLFGYELNDPVLAAADAEVQSLRPTEGYLMIPEQQVFAETFDVTVANFGTDPLDTLFVDFEVSYGGSPVFNDTQMALNVPSAGTADLTSVGFTPASGQGNYTVSAVARLGANQTDGNAANDSLGMVFAVTDSLMARDNDLPTGASYGIQGPESAIAGVLFELTAADTVTAVWIRSDDPVDGDTTYAVVWQYDDVLMGPSIPIIDGAPIFFQAGQNEYLLPIYGGQALPPGKYVFGCYQAYNGDLNLSTSPELWTPGTNFFFIAGTGWFGSTVQSARFIRPVFGTILMVGVEDELPSSEVAVYPNPADGAFKVAFSAEFQEEVNMVVTNSVGAVVWEKDFNPSLAPVVDVDLDQAAAGVYFVRVRQGDRQLVKKVMLSK